MEVFSVLTWFIPCYVISAVIHELGHVVVGIVNGFRFELLVAGPFGLRRNDNGRLSLYIERNPAFWGGVGATLPRNDDARNYSAFASVLLAGPLSSIMVSAVAIPIGLATDALIFLLVGFMSLGMGVVSLIPMRNGCFYTDGGRWLRMRRQGQDGQVEAAIWRINQALAVNQNLAAIAPSEMDVLKRDKDPRNRYLGHYYSYKHYLDVNDHAAAEEEKEHIQQLTAKVPKSFIKLLPI